MSLARSNALCLALPLVCLISSAAIAGGPVADTAVDFGNGKVYFFKGGEYARYDIAADRADPGFPRRIAGKWPGLWDGGVELAFTGGNGKAYFFKGSEYVRYDIAADRADPGYPRPIAGNWRGLWSSGIDAAYHGGNGKIYFFRGAEYVRYDVATDRADPGFPRPIAGNWPGLWNGGIELAFTGGNGKAYFFKGGEYVRYDIAADRVDPGYPRPVAGRWPGVWDGAPAAAPAAGPPPVPAPALNPVPPEVAPRCPRTFVSRDGSCSPHPPREAASAVTASLAEDPLVKQALDRLRAAALPTPSSPRDMIPIYKRMVVPTLDGAQLRIDLGEQNVPYVNARQGSGKRSLAELDRIQNAIIKGGDPRLKDVLKAVGAQALMDVYQGKGSPRVIPYALMIVDHLRDRVRFADAKAREEYLRDYYLQYIGLDCNGFVDNYFRLKGGPIKISRPIHLLHWETGHPKALHRQTLAEIRKDDLLIFSGGSHVAIVDDILPRSDFRVSVVEAVSDSRAAGDGLIESEYVFGGPVVQSLGASEVMGDTSSPLYELRVERGGGNSADPKLTPEQRERILKNNPDVDRMYRPAVPRFSAGLKFRQRDPKTGEWKVVDGGRNFWVVQPKR